MDVSQAIDYLETTIDIPVRDMSPSMYVLLNCSARIVQRSHPGMIGYYDPEFDGRRIDLSKHLTWPSRNLMPQSVKLQAKTAPVIRDYWGSNSAALFD